MRLVGHRRNEIVPWLCGVEEMQRFGIVWSRQLSITGMITWYNIMRQPGETVEQITWPQNARQELGDISRDDGIQFTTIREQERIRGHKVIQITHVCTHIHLHSQVTVHKAKLVFFLCSPHRKLSHNTSQSEKCAFESPRNLV